MNYTNVKRGRQAFTLIEVLIALSICAILMVAVASAFNASIINFQENQKMYTAMNKARQAMARMTTEIRNADWVLSVSSTECKVEFFAGNDFYLDSKNVKVLYKYDATNDQLQLKRWIDDVENPSGFVTLCSDVEGVTFASSTNLSGDIDGVRIVMNGVGCDATQNLASAVVVRRRIEE